MSSAFSKFVEIGLVEDYEDQEGPNCYNAFSSSIVDGHIVT